MSRIVQNWVWEEIPKLNREYAQAQPFPHFVVDDFLDESFSRKLLAEFPPFERERATNEHGITGGKSVREDLGNIGPSFSELHQLFSSQKFLDWMSYVTEIPDLIFDPSYMGGGTHENLPGQDMSVHIDFNYHPVQGWHRRVNALLYLNPEWEEDWGGQLELWKNPRNPRDGIKKISPGWNKLVVFGTTESSWHGFEKVNIPEAKRNAVASRKSVAIYLYSRERPKAETEASHSTVYYERPMPETIRAGTILSQKDYDEIIRLTVRRDELLKFLYKRELQFSQATNGLNSAIAEYRRRREGWKNEFLAGGSISVEAAGAGEFLVKEGASVLPLVGPSFRLKTERAENIKTGDWLVAQNGFYRAVKKIGNCFLSWEVGRNKPALVPAEAIQARVVAVKDEFGESVGLHFPMAAVPKRQVLLAHIFVKLHQLKHLIFGKAHSRVLWWISCRYREILKSLGMEVPVLLPSQSQNSRKA